ncbi:GcrA family cell cycle regulator [Sneathiella limimaris]|uniref:GcrA family cell cycle regulator n=1 Tax=Sneathiella limimaris TaxID=1964213 RepID=UPI00146E775E|nr:GcrA family cell cycle regulator [Sneathiella limimaris]
MSWTEERIEKLKSLWGSGKTAAEIAEELGGVTRNAVIGKANRLGLSNKSSTTAAPKAKKKAVPAHRACQWPIGHPGEPDFHFCGDESVPSKPYCLKHCNMAYQSRDNN